MHKQDSLYKEQSHWLLRFQLKNNNRQLSMWPNNSNNKPKESWNN